MSQQPGSKKTIQAVAKSSVGVVADDDDVLEADASDVDVDDVVGDENEMVVVIDHSQGSDGEQVSFIMFVN